MLSLWESRSYKQFILLKLVNFPTVLRYNSYVGERLGGLLKHTGWRSDGRVRARFSTQNNLIFIFFQFSKKNFLAVIFLLSGLSRANHKLWEKRKKL